MKEGGGASRSFPGLELSLVTIPANADCTIDRIKSIDAEVWPRQVKKSTTATGVPDPACVTASRNKTTKIKEITVSKPKSYAEQITALEATRQAKAARREEIQNTVADDDRTKDETEREEFDDLGNSIKAVDRELVDLRELEKQAKSSAVCRRQRSGGGLDLAFRRSCRKRQAQSGTRTSVCALRHGQGALVQGDDARRTRSPSRCGRITRTLTQLRRRLRWGRARRSQHLVTPTFSATDMIEYLALHHRRPHQRPAPLFNIVKVPAADVRCIRELGRGGTAETAVGLRAR